MQEFLYFKRLYLLAKTHQPICGCLAAELVRVVRVWSFVALLVDLNVTRLLATRSFLYKQKNIHKQSYYLLIDIVSAFRDWGVPGPTSEMSPRAPAQMGRRETEREGGKKAAQVRERWKSRGLRVCPAPRSGALAVEGYKRPRERGASGLTRAPVPSSSLRGQPSVRGPWSFLL
jgi:hypothetical protein